MALRIARAVIVLLHAAMSVGCGSEPAPARSPREPVTSRPAPALTQATPSIISITPDIVRVTNGRAEGGSYQVDYEIPGAALVTNAELQVYAPGIGVVQKMALSAQDRDTVTFDLDSSTDFGPTIAFRARCPGGETERYVLGTDRTSAEGARAGFRISSVMPNQINLDRALVAGNGDLPDGAGIPVTIFGPELTPECKPSATVDGREVELMNVMAQRGQIRSLLLYRDIGGRYVSSRYLEVKLSVRGDGFARVNIARIRFVE